MRVPREVESQHLNAEDPRRQFLRFCRFGRLAGTKGNLEAVGFLKESLEREGYAAHIHADPRFALLPAAFGVGLAVLAVVYWIAIGQLSLPIAGALFLGPMLKAADSMRSGTPLAVFGIRSATCESPAPTVILGAHFDTVSLPLQGSFFTACLIVVVFMAGVLAIADRVSPLVAVLASGATGFFLYGNASPGGDDNASGVFAVLECARHLKSVSNVNVVPVFFNFEEEGLFGSLSFSRHFLGRRGRGLPDVNFDPSNSFVINFDCVGRGKRIYMSGDKDLAQMILSTSAAREMEASVTPFYPSDHLMFKKPWKAISFARANRYWMLDLSWIHSRTDVAEKVDLIYIREVASIAVEFVRSIGS